METDGPGASSRGAPPDASSNMRASAEGPQRPAAPEGEAVEMPSLFSTRRPCHLGSGLSSGLKSVAKGVGLGLTTLVAAPVVGAAEGGVGGFFKGLAAGVAGGVFLPVGGVLVGSAQIARGAYNTPGAVYSASTGKHWDRCAASGMAGASCDA